MISQKEDEFTYDIIQLYIDSIGTALLMFIRSKKKKKKEQGTVRYET